MPMELQREHIWNVQVHTADLPNILDTIDNGIASGVKGRTLFCANPHSLVVARKDSSFLNALSCADILIPDGAGIVFASQLLGGRIARRITGSDVIVGVAERWNKLIRRGESFFFLGSSNEVLEKIKARMSRDYPNIPVCGMYSPSFNDEFSDEENDRMIDAVNQAAPTVLWVGMTAPKQEKWVHQNRRRLDIPLIAAVGAAFDYFAGTKKRASFALQTIGLEWLPRLFREPRRMWKRNFVSTPIFLYHVLQQRLFISRSNAQNETKRNK